MIGPCNASVTRAGEHKFDGEENQMLRLCVAGICMVLVNGALGQEEDMDEEQTDE
jgi:hypothetical protein